MGRAPAFSGGASGRSKGNMYGEAGRGKGHHASRGRGDKGGDGDWKNQKSRLQMAQEEDALEAGLGFVNFTEGDERLGWLVNVSSVSARTTRYGRFRRIGRYQRTGSHRSIRDTPVDDRPARHTSRARFKISQAWHPTPFSRFSNFRKLTDQTLLHPRDPDHHSGARDRQGVQRRQLLLHAAGRRDLQGAGPVRPVLSPRHQTRLRTRRRGVSSPPVRG